MQTLRHLTKGKSKDRRQTYLVGSKEGSGGCPPRMGAKATGEGQSGGTAAGDCGVRRRWTDRAETSRRRKLRSGRRQRRRGDDGSTLSRAAGRSGERQAGRFLRRTRGTRQNRPNKVQLGRPAIPIHLRIFELTHLPVCLRFVQVLPTV